MAAKKEAKSTYTVRTDAVYRFDGEAAFLRGEVKLSEEEAKPLLREGKASKE